MPGSTEYPYATVKFKFHGSSHGEKEMGGRNDVACNTFAGNPPTVLERASTSSSGLIHGLY